MSLPPRVREIIADTAAAHGVTPADLLGPTHRAKVCRARWEAFGRCRALTNPTPSLARIGEWFNRDHTTVIHGLARLTES